MDSASAVLSSLSLYVHVLSSWQLCHRHTEHIYSRNFHYYSLFSHLTLHSWYSIHWSIIIRLISLFHLIYIEKQITHIMQLYFTMSRLVTNFSDVSMSLFAGLCCQNHVVQYLRLLSEIRYKVLITALLWNESGLNNLNYHQLTNPLVSRLISQHA